MRLAELQRSFIDYLVNGDNTLTQLIADQGTIAVETRLKIYSNAYRQRLYEAIDSDHAMLGIYLGDELFDQMVDAYIRQYPSNTHTLRHFADHLPTFLQETAPFCQHPHIAELARFERLLMDVFDASYADSVTLEQLHSLPPANWPAMTLRFHPSLQVFECRWNSVEIWQALKQEEVPPDARSQANGSWLLWRNPQRLSEFTSLSQAQQAFLRAALAGKDFADMCETLLHFVDEQTASQLAVQTLTQWIQSGLVTQLKY